MRIAGLEEQIPSAKIWVPEMGRFSPVVRFVDSGYRTAGINKEDAKNAEKIDKKRTGPAWRMRVKMGFQAGF